MSTIPTLLICYAQADSEFKETFLRYFSRLDEQSYLRLWEDTRLELDFNAVYELEEELQNAQVILLLVSRHFLVSSFIRNTHVLSTLKRLHGSEKRIVPLILSACNWGVLDFCKSNAQPKGFVPIERVQYPEQSWAVVVKRIHEWSKYPHQKAAGQENLPALLIDVSQLPPLPLHFVGRTYQLLELDQVFAQKEGAIVGLIADAGVGKTTLLHHWVRRLAPTFGGVKRVLYWSFQAYQGGNIPSASNLFFEYALPFFGHQGALPLAEDAKAKRLVQLLKERSGILILDSLQYLQYRPQRQNGMFADMGLRTLVYELRRQALGGQRLVVLVSRQPIYELNAGECQYYHVLTLGNLNQGDGATLLERLGVLGTPWELNAVARLCCGHAFALCLLGNLLVDAFAADINRHQRILESTPEVADHSRYATQIMRFYDEERWVKNAPERIFMYLVALVDRPLTVGERDELLKGATVAQPLLSHSEVDWHLMVMQLRKQGLLQERGEQIEEAFGAHPLVRQYFSEQFRVRDPENWEQAHRVLFHYFQHLPAQEQPNSLRELEPLYRAMYHACQAGEYRMALDVIYHRRILRGGEYYSTRQLGAYSQDLAALAYFFSAEWTQPISESLTEYDQSWLLAQASFYLMSSGRLEEAIAPQELALRIREGNADWKNAAHSGINLVDLLLALGQIEAACAMAEKAMVFAERSCDPYTQMCGEAKYAAALYRKGELGRCLGLFARAEGIQVADQPQHPFLYSLAGAQYCLALLEAGRSPDVWQNVLERSQSALVLSQQELGLLSVAFDQLIRACALQKLQYPLESVRTYFDEAVNQIRKANVLIFLPEFLLQRAQMHRQRGNLTEAQRDVEEVLELVKRCGMRLYEAEGYLLQGNLLLDRKRQESQPIAGLLPPRLGLYQTDVKLQESERAYQQAAGLIKALGYELRRAELSLLAARIAFYARQPREAFACLEEADKKLSSMQQGSLQVQWEAVSLEIA